MPFFCDIDYRTNELSQKPGGFVVQVTRQDGKRISYPNVKNPKMYIEVALRSGAKEAHVIGRNGDFDFNKFEIKDEDED